MNIPVRNVYYLLAYAWGQADAARERLATSAEVETLPDLLAHVLAQRVASLIRRGLDRSYVEERVVIPGVRGKLDLSETLKRNLLLEARTQCIVEELQHDVLHNQILRSTLGRLLSLPRLDSKVRNEVGLIYRKLGEIGTIPLRRANFRRVRVHRNNRSYRFLMHLCKLIHDCLHLEEDGSTTFFDTRQRRKVMSRIFEQFVSNFYRAEQEVYDVQSQGRLSWHRPKSTRLEDLDLLPSMVPDAVLVAGQRRIVVETKYYREPLHRNRYGARRVRAAHLYQIFAYLENRNAEAPEGPSHEGILLYPVVNEAFRYDFELKGHRIQVRTIDLGLEWWQIRDDLLALVDC